MNKIQCKKELERMDVKREQICIELGHGYDWQLQLSLNAITDKINQYEEIYKGYDKEIYE
ncbi:MAG: hypothetical protein K0S01_2442 [Herbinix sp.]|nr:hypothetical protein [Herbinix sp.]